MGLIKFFGNVIQIGARNKRSDRDFDLCMMALDKLIKKAEKLNDESLKDTYINRKIDEAYTHKTVKSALWWVNNLPAGTLNFEKLHAKFKHSVENEDKWDKHVTREQQEQFVALSLKDSFDYSQLGYENKAAFVKKMMASYDELLKSKDYNVKSNASPYLTFEFWSYCECKRISEEGKAVDSDVVKQEYDIWFSAAIKLFSKKFGSYSYIH